VAAVAEAVVRLDAALTSPRWFQTKGESQLDLVAYFSPEFGISEAVPQYSGGLGVLAGDHLKASSDLGVPLVGIGLLYAEGYFRQMLDADGWQQERFPRLEPAGMALSNTGKQVTVELGGDTVTVSIWRSEVGRLPLYLLDAPGVTDRLYGGDVEHRLRQEIVLGVAGVRALERSTCTLRCSTRTRATPGSWRWSASANWWRVVLPSPKRWRPLAPVGCSRRIRRCRPASIDSRSS